MSATPKGPTTATEATAVFDLLPRHAQRPSARVVCATRDEWLEKRKEIGRAHV